MMRQEAFDRVRQVEREFETATWAVGAVAEQLRSGEYTELPAAVSPRDVERTLAQLEITYIVRLFAEFEWILRDYWATMRRTEPATMVLVNRIAARQRIGADWLAGAQEVRENRNNIIHQGQRASGKPFNECRAHLTRFLSKLPLQW